MDSLAEGGTCGTDIIDKKDMPAISEPFWSVQLEDSTDVTMPCHTTRHVRLGDVGVFTHNGIGNDGQWYYGLYATAYPFCLVISALTIPVSSQRDGYHGIYTLEEMFLQKVTAKLTDDKCGKHRVVAVFDIDDDVVDTTSSAIVVTTTCTLHVTTIPENPKHRGVSKIPPSHNRKLTVTGSTDNLLTSYKLPTAYNAVVWYEETTQSMQHKP